MKLSREQQQELDRFNRIYEKNASAQKSEQLYAIAALLTIVDTLQAPQAAPMPVGTSLGVRVCANPHCFQPAVEQVGAVYYCDKHVPAGAAAPVATPSVEASTAMVVHGFKIGDRVTCPEIKTSGVIEEWCTREGVAKQHEVNRFAPDLYMLVKCDDGALRGWHFDAVKHEADQLPAAARAVRLSDTAKGVKITPAQRKALEFYAESPKGLEITYTGLLRIAEPYGSSIGKIQHATYRVLLSRQLIADNSELSGRPSDAITDLGRAALDSH